MYVLPSAISPLNSVFAAFTRISSPELTQFKKRWYSAFLAFSCSTNGSLSEPDDLLEETRDFEDELVSICLRKSAISLTVSLYSLVFGFKFFKASFFLAIACSIAPTVPAAYSFMPPIPAFFNLSAPSFSKLYADS